MSDNDRPERQRRRLFSRRELRHQGTRIVRVGSANVLQSNRGQYKFAALHSASPSPTPPTEPHELIDPPSLPNTEQNSALKPKYATPKRPSKPKPKMYGITQMSARARRLRVSPSQQRMSQPLFQVDRLLSSSSLPPPLNLDQTILTYPEPGARKQSLSLSASQLAPVRQVPKRLKPISHSPQPLFSVNQGL
ncbi:hypothetical protein EV183_003309 [Coemansia sp. RSA 2336]|nr:hypothetical protein EV183_003309 [Coemansia sp. RSA 2336]